LLFGRGRFALRGRMPARRRAGKLIAMFRHLRRWTISCLCVACALTYLGVTVLRFRAERVYDEGIAVGGGSWEFGARSGGPGLGVAFYRGRSELRGVQTWCYRTSGQADRHAGKMADHVRHRLTWSAGADLEYGTYRLALRPDGSTAERQDPDVGLRSPVISYWTAQHVPHEWVMAATALPPLVWAVRRVRRSAVRRRRARQGLCVNCGYDLRGNPERCSECGQAAPDHERRTADGHLSPVTGPAAVGLNGAKPTGEAD
jgi:hypothetical protein